MEFIYLFCLLAVVLVSLITASRLVLNFYEIYFLNKYKNKVIREKSMSFSEKLEFNKKVYSLMIIQMKRKFYNIFFVSASLNLLLLLIPYIIRVIL